MGQRVVWVGHILGDLCAASKLERSARWEWSEQMKGNGDTSRMQDAINQSNALITTGIDVGRTVVDMNLIPTGETLQVTNDATGLRRLIRHCLRRSVQLIALEATGRYHRLAHQMMHEAGLVVAVINPYRSRKFTDLEELGQATAVRWPPLPGWPQ